MTCSFAASSTSPSAADPEDLIGGRRDIECSFRLGLNGPDETYVGTLQFVGHAKEVLGKGALMFVAKAPGSSQFQGWHDGGNIHHASSLRVELAAAAGWCQRKQSRINSCWSRLATTTTAPPSR